MNFLRYFCLVAAAALVVFSQQSAAGAEDRLDAIENKLDPGIQSYRDAINFIRQLVPENINANSSDDPFIKLREGFFNGTQMLSSARSTILDGVVAAEKILAKNPEGARKLTQQACADGISILYTVGPPFNKALGGALGLSNDGARQGLLSASKYLLKGGLALLNSLKSGQSLFNDGSEAGGRAAKASLNVYHLAIETGFAAMFYDVEKSANESLQALRDAQSSPIQLRIENRSCGVAAKEDPDCSDALEDINQAAKNALRNGANPALVQQLEEIVKCALDSIVQIDVDAKRESATTKKLAEIDTFAAMAQSSEACEDLEKRINQLFSQLYVDFGDVCARFGNQSDEKVQSGFVVLEKGNVEMLSVIKFCKQMIEIGVQNGGDASMLAMESVAKAIYYAKLVYIQSLAKAAKIVFTLL